MTNSLRAAKASMKFIACAEAFRALRCVSGLVERVEGRNPFGDHEDAVPDLAALLAVIADRGFEDAQEGLEYSQELEERVGGGL